MNDANISCIASEVELTPELKSVVVHCEVQFIAGRMNLFNKRLSLPLGLPVADSAAPVKKKNKINIITSIY